MAKKINTSTIVLKEVLAPNSDINEQGKKAIFQFMKELKISKIIYVDDRCGIQEHKEEFLATLKSLYSSKPEGINFVNWEAPERKFDKDIERLWEDSNDDVKRNLFLEVLNFIGNEDDLENSTAPLTLKKQLGDKIQLFSPTEWEIQKDQVLQPLNQENKFLVLFDIFFESAPLESGRNGIDLTEELLSRQDIKDYVYCGIFSHHFSEEDEVAKRNEIHKDRGFDKKRFYTISKKRFSNNLYLPGLAEGIRNTLLVNEVELLKTESEGIVKKSLKDSVEEIKNLDPESFNHIIVHSSFEEGIWEMLTLLRLKSIITQDNALKHFLNKRKRAKINTYLKNIRKIKDIKTGASTSFDRAHIQSLREKELNFNQEILNELHFPISNGDIFKIKGKEYILIGQPCNFALRKTGQRDIMGGKVYDSGFLLKIETLNKDKFDKYNAAQRATLGVLQSSDSNSNRVKYVRFPLYKTVSLAPLDLTVFNTDGSATINLNKTECSSPTIQESWKAHYKNIHKEFSKYKKYISTFNKLKSLEKHELKNLVYYGEIFKGYNINNENILNPSGNKLTFDIKRISRYKEPYSNDLLQQFMEYLSRNAFDRDFLRD